MKMPVRGRRAVQVGVTTASCPRRPGVGNSPPVDAPETPPTLDQLNGEIRDVALQVHLAEERKDERDVVAAAHAGVDRLSRRYRELLQSLSPGEQMNAERALGRRVVDLKRLASLLPKIPAAATPRARPIAPRAAARPKIAASPASRGRTQRRAPDGQAGRRRRRRVVVRQVRRVAPPTASSRWSATSRSRCSVRSADRATRTAPGPRGGRRRAPIADRRRRPPARRRPRGAEEGRRAARAGRRGRRPPTSVRVFDPKERYKAGEIIVHPEYGRGKIENVLRSSLLVRFSGRRPEVADAQ